MNAAPSASQPELYFHVGLGKVASTYLQYQFFPFLEGIRYIQRTRYRQSPRLIRREKAPRYLVSREFDRQLKREVDWFAGYFPQARTIILLRRHDSWIASQYRRWIKNGRPGTFDQFFDLAHDQGHWKQEDLRFYPMLEALRTAFAHPPLVLFYEDMQADPWAVFDRMAHYMGASYRREAISLRPRHTSYSEHQLKVLRRCGPYLKHIGWKQVDFPPLRVAQRLTRQLTVYSVMSAARLLPEAAAPKEPLIPTAQLEAIREAYQDDWARCVAFAQRHVPDRAPA